RHGPPRYLSTRPTRRSEASREAPWTALALIGGDSAVWRWGVQLGAGGTMPVSFVAGGPPSYMARGPRGRPARTGGPRRGAFAFAIVRQTRCATFRHRYATAAAGGGRWAASYSAGGTWPRAPCRRRAFHHATQAAVARATAAASRHGPCR